MRLGRFAAACALGAMATDAAAQEPAGAQHGAEGASPPASAEVERDDVRVGRLISEERFKEALEVVQALPEPIRSSQDVRFLEAFLLRRTGAPLRAADKYLAMLAQDPNLPRVRLELAQAYREAGDDVAAERNFRLALAGGLPADTQLLVQSILDDLNRRRRWRIFVEFGVSPDSNVNSATEAREVDIFGLPFKLNDDARRRSGWTGAFSGRAEKVFKPFGGPSIKTDLSAAVVENEGGDFDQYVVESRVGPEIGVRGVRIAVQGVGQRQWFAGDGFSRSYGGVVDVRSRGARKQIYAAVLRGVVVEHDRAVALDGVDLSLTGARTAFPSTRTVWTASAAVRRLQAEVESNAFWEVSAALEVSRAWPYSVTTSARVGVAPRWYDAPDALNSTPRRDVALTGEIRVFARAITLYGFAPFVGAEYARTFSTSELNDFDRVRGTLGVSRLF